MQFDVIPAQLLKRYKRFLIDAQLANGDIVQVHCPNPGSLMSVIDAPQPIWLQRAKNPLAKLKYRALMVAKQETLIGIDTHLANDLVAEAIANNMIQPLAEPVTMQREVTYGDSRFDFVLINNTHKLVMEVKNVSLSLQPGVASFPDSPSERATKHMMHLAQRVSQGAHCALLFVIQRQNCKTFTLAETIDPLFAQAARHAQSAGVHVMAAWCDLSINNHQAEIKIAECTPVTL